MTVPNRMKFRKTFKITYGMKFRVTSKMTYRMTFMMIYVMTFRMQVIIHKNLGLWRNGGGLGC